MHQEIEDGHPNSCKGSNSDRRNGCSSVEALHPVLLVDSFNLVNYDMVSFMGLAWL